MLVLSRKLNQKIRIGDNVTMTIESITGNNVRIGFEAPPDVKILRTELEVVEDAGLSPIPLDTLSAA